VSPRGAVNLVALLGVVLSIAVVSASAGPAARPKPAKPAKAAADTAAVRRQVIAYYLHGKARCSNCVKIENWSREAIETAYPEELADGRLAWKVVDVEAKGNEHFVEDFQLYTKSLVLVEQIGGKQVRWKNCARVWEHLTGKEGFLAYVRAEVAAYLKGTP
jgi:hypothetical protein